MSVFEPASLKGNFEIADAIAVLCAKNISNHQSQINSDNIGYHHKLIANALGVDSNTVGAALHAIQAKTSDTAFPNLAAPIFFDLSQLRYQPAAVCAGFIGRYFASEISNVLQQITKLPSTCFNSDNVQASYCHYLVIELSNWLFKAINEELTPHITDAQHSDPEWDIKLSARLASDSFVAYFARKYPLIIDLSRKRLRYFSDNFLALLTRFEKDSSRLALLLGLNMDDIYFASVSFNAGDSHRQGKSVAIVELKNGDKLVYKPRNLSPEQGFYRYLSWLNKQSDFDFLIPKLLCFEDYGWQEFIDAFPIKNKAELSDYFYRYGALVAAAQAVNLTDIHFENLISAGKQPVVVDAETIGVSPNLRSNGKVVERCGAMFSTVLYTGLINETFLGDTRLISPLQSMISTERATTLYIYDNKLKFNKENTVVYRHPHFDSPHFISDVNWQRARVQQGFSAAYNVILENRTHFVSTGLEHCFSQLTARVVLKPTKFYHQILELIKSPLAAASAEHRDKILFKLLESNQKEGLATEICLAEWQCLINGDVPYFSNEVSSTGLKSGSGILLNHILTTPSLDAIGLAMASMNTTRLNDELGLIHQHFACKQDTGSFKVPPKREIIYQKLRNNLHFNGHQLDCVIDVYLPRAGAARYMNIANIFNLNYGMPGICLALAYHEQINAISQHIAPAVSEHIARTFDSSQIEKIGINEGAGGLVYLFSHLASLYQNTFYLRFAHYVFDKLISVAHHDRLFDVFSGTSGAILAGLSLYQVQPSQLLIQKLELLGGHLLSFSKSTELGLIWESSTPTGAPTTGFAHGVSGIGYSLLQLYSVTQNSSYLSAAKQCKTFVMNCYHDTQWLETPDKPVPFNAWCHGSVGISLFLIAFAKITGCDDTRQFLIERHSLLLTELPTKADCICHGRYGNIEVLLQDTEDFLPQLSRHEQQHTVSQLLHTNAELSVGAKGNNTGLFSGLSGVLYQLNRLEAPHRLPCLLTFQPPINHFLSNNK
ncbi:type 2 lanthipeptide synthetase LanM family protein [Rheinheimera gaetbuli]